MRKSILKRIFKEEWNSFIDLMEEAEWERDLEIKKDLVAREALKKLGYKLEYVERYEIVNETADPNPPNEKYGWNLVRVKNEDWKERLRKGFAKKVKARGSRKTIDEMIRFIEDLLVI